MKKFAYAVLGVAIGGLLGGALALMFAPASGQETRKEISNYIGNLQEEVKKAATEKREELEIQLKALRSGKKAEAAE